MAVIFLISVSTRFRNYFQALKINSSDILFNSFSIAIISESIFEWEVAFVWFCKKRHTCNQRGLRYGLKFC